MCGRYNIDFEANKELKQMMKALNEKYPGNRIKSGEIFPTDQAAILTQEEGEVTPKPLIWGYPQFTGKGIIINARADGVLEKVTFKESMMHTRCVVPTTGFYEWSYEKKKFLFTRAGYDVVYLGGLWKMIKNEKRFVIITTSANGSVREIHSRMPIILDQDQIEPWLNDYEYAKDILNREMAVLEKKAV